MRRGASPRPIDDPKWFADKGRGWVRIRDVTAAQSSKLLTTEQYLSDAGVSKSVSVDPGELIMSICATIGVPRLVGVPVCIHDGFVVFRKHDKSLDTSFLYFFLQFIAEKLSAGGQPGTQKNLNTTIVGAIQTPWISLKEQAAIAEALEYAEMATRAHASSVENLRYERRALMQQLLSGKRRVRP
ncbi:restriction endonuclease subunit S [Mesorhizobium sp. M0306]